MPDPAPRGIPCVVMRGGTSKAIFLWEDDLPAIGKLRDQVIEKIFGSPDARQVDGLGGADPLTSKVAIISRDAPAGSDLTYTFGQVGIEEGGVDYESLCGNITAAVGHFAVSEGLCEVAEPSTRVAIFNTNHQCVLYVDVPAKNSRPVDVGDFVVPGVPGTGAALRVDLGQTAGAISGYALPTGMPRDLLEVGENDALEVSLVDVGNPHVFVRASDFGRHGAESAADLAADVDLMRRLERVRGAAAVRFGLVDDVDRARADSPAIPILGLVGVPASYIADTAGETIESDDCDLVSRLMFMQRPHKAYAGTSTVCTGVAARLPGTVVSEVAREPRADAPHLVRIGHPQGVIVTEVRFSGGGRDVRVERATVDRTARRILTGTVYI